MLSEEEYSNLWTSVFNSKYYIHCCILFIGLVGNITVVTVILSSKSFHALTGYYLLSLSAADLLILSAGVSFHVFGFKFKWLNGGGFARYIGEWACQVSLIVPIWTVMTFTVERYLAICHPFFVQSLSKTSRVKQIILGIWLIAALLALIPTALIAVAYLGEEEAKMAEKAAIYIADVSLALCFIIPISAIITMYLLIWIKLKRSSNNKEMARQRANRADTRMLMMFVIIVVSFVLSWAPIYIYRVLYGHWIQFKYRTAEYDEDFVTLMQNIDVFRVVTLILYPLSSALNPIIFSLMSSKFREAFKDLVSSSSRKLSDWSSRLIGSRNNSSTVETTA